MALLRQRCRQPEVMDQPDLARDRHVHALSGLARINFFSRSSRLLFHPLLDLQQRRRWPGQPLRILDVASGGGDVPIRLWLRAARAGLDWHLAGCDVSPLAVDHARARAQTAGAEVSFFVHDALAQPLPSPYDAVICSLFLHHLDEEQAVGLLRSMAWAVRSQRAEGRGQRSEESGPGLVVVSDLARCWQGLLLAHLATRLLTTSDVVHTDGPLSVRAAFTPAEALGLAQRAGLDGARVRRRWPCRWVLQWSRP
jgi:hypothetical protein